MAPGSVKQQLAIDVIVKDQASRELKVIGRNAAGMGDKAERGFNKGSKGAAKFTDKLGVLAKKAGLAGAALTAAYSVGRVASQGIQNARDFGEAMGEVRTLLSGTGEEAEFVRDRLLDLAGAYGLDEVDLAKSFYQALSAGITDTGEALGILETSAKLGLAAIGQTSQGVDLLTTTLEAFEIGIEGSADAAEILFALVADGKTNLGELGGTFGAVLARAAALGLSLEETAAAIAVLTKTAGSTSKAVTLFGGLLNAVQLNSEKLTEAFGDAGIAFDATTIKGEGFAQFLRDLSTVIGDDTGKLQELLVSQEAFGGAIALTGSKVDSFVTSLEGISKAGGGIDRSLAQRMEEPAQKLTIALKQAELAATKFGVRALESFGKVFDKLEESDELRDLLARLGDDLAVLAELGFKFVETNALAFLDALELIAPAIEAASTGATEFLKAGQKLGEMFDTIGDSATVASSALTILFTDKPLDEKLAEIQRMAAALENLRGSAQQGATFTLAPEETLADPGASERGRVKALGDSAQAARAMNAVLKAVNTDTLTGLAKERVAFQDKLQLATQTAIALRETGTIGESAYRRLRAAILTAKEAGLEFFATQESAGLDALLDKTRQLEEERLTGLEAQLRAVDRLIDARITEAKVAAEGNAEIRDNIDIVVLGLEMERGKRRELVQETYEQAQAQEALSQALEPRVFAAEQDILNQAYQRTVDVLGVAALGTAEFADELRAAITAAQEGGEAFSAGFRSSLDDFVDFTRNDLALGAEVAATTGRSLTDNLAGGLQDVASGAATGSEAVRSFAQGFAASMLQVSTQAIALKTVGGVLSAFGAGGSGEGGGAGLLASATAAGTALSSGGAAAAGAISVSGTTTATALTSAGTVAGAAISTGGASASALLVTAGASLATEMVAGATAAATILAAAGSVTALASGGVVPGGLGNLQTIPYAGGGPIVRSPHVALVGEGQYDEAVVPLPNGREIPVDLRGLDLGGGRGSGGQIQEAPTTTTIAPTIVIQQTVDGGRSADQAARSAITPETLRMIQDSVASAIASGSHQGLRNSVKAAR